MKPFKLILLIVFIVLTTQISSEKLNAQDLKKLQDLFQSPAVPILQSNQIPKPPSNPNAVQAKVVKRSSTQPLKNETPTTNKATASSSVLTTTQVKPESVLTEWIEKSKVSTCGEYSFPSTPNLDAKFSDYVKQGTYKEFIFNKFIVSNRCLQTAFEIFCSHHKTASGITWEELKESTTIYGNPDEYMKPFLLLRSFANYLTIGYTEYSLQFMHFIPKRFCTVEKYVDLIPDEFKNIVNFKATGGLEFTRPKGKDNKTKIVTISNVGSSTAYSDIDQSVFIKNSGEIPKNNLDHCQIKPQADFVGNFDNIFRNCFGKASFPIFDLNIYITGFADVILGFKSCVEDLDYKNLEIDHNFAMLNLKFLTQNPINTLNSAFDYLVRRNNQVTKKESKVRTFDLKELSEMKTDTDFSKYYKSKCFTNNGVSGQTTTPLPEAEARFKIHQCFIRQAYGEESQAQTIETAEKALVAAYNENEKFNYYVHKAEFFANEAYYTRGAIIHVLEGQRAKKENRQPKPELYNEFVMLNSAISNIKMGLEHFKDFLEKANKPNSESTDYFLYEATTKIAKYFNRVHKALITKTKFGNEEVSLDDILGISRNIAKSNDAKYNNFVKFTETVLHLKSDHNIATFAKTKQIAGIIENSLKIKYNKDMKLYNHAETVILLIVNSMDIPQTTSNQLLRRTKSSIN